MSKEVQYAIYVAPLAHDDFLKVGHTTIGGLERRQSRLRRELGEAKLELYPMLVYPPDTPSSANAVSFLSARTLSRSPSLTALLTLAGR